MLSCSHTQGVTQIRAPNIMDIISIVNMIDSIVKRGEGEYNINKGTGIPIILISNIGNNILKCFEREREEYGLYPLNIDTYIVGIETKGATAPNTPNFGYCFGFKKGKKEIEYGAEVIAPATVTDNFFEKEEREGYKYLFEAPDGAYTKHNNGLIEYAFAPGIGACSNGFIVFINELSCLRVGTIITIIGGYFDSFNRFSRAALTVITVAAIATATAGIGFEY